MNLSTDSESRYIDECKNLKEHDLSRVQQLITKAAH